jgi:hypothetical protein
MADYRKEITRYTIFSIFWTMGDYSKKLQGIKYFGTYSNLRSVRYRSWTN